MDKQDAAMEDVDVDTGEAYKSVVAGAPPASSSGRNTILTEPAHDIPKMTFHLIAAVLMIASGLCLVFGIIAATRAFKFVEGSDPNGVRLVPVAGVFCGALSAFFALAVLTEKAFLVLVSPVGLEDLPHEQARELNTAWRAVQVGARAFLHTEYIWLAVFVAVVAVVLALVNLPEAIKSEKIWTILYTPITFITGAATSAVCGYGGMSIATQANARTTNAVRGGLQAGLKLAFDAGSVMGLAVVGSGLLLLSVLFLLFRDVSYLAGAGFGASSIALFARVGGGIYTKAADVGSDLCGKLELGLEEDDARNPATIADNVGDNVGDVAGMGADLFESYIGSIIAVITLGAEVFPDPVSQEYAMAAPFYIAAGGIICSIIGAQLVYVAEEGDGGIMSLLNWGSDTQEKLLWAIRRGIFAAAILAAILGSIIIFLLDLGWQIVVCYLLGLVSGVLIGVFTEYYTSFSYSPVKKIAAAGESGSAVVIIRGLAVGQESTVPPTIIMFVTIIACVSIGNLKGDGIGMYGLGMAAVGMLSTLGVTLATDAYGPIADNAGGIAEMVFKDDEDEGQGKLREKTDALDALGNTTAATGKGFAIGSAILTAIALLRAFWLAVNKDCHADGKVPSVDLLSELVMGGVLIGAMLPYVFAALTMLAVGDAAQCIIGEVKRQWPTIQAGGGADYQACIGICTKMSLRMMVMPGALAILTPVVMGFVFGPKLLVGLLAGAIISGFLLAVSMANSGGAWDNAKKYVEAKKLRLPVKEPGEDVEGSIIPNPCKKEKQYAEYTTPGKGTSIHAAVVVGDTVGDPFKDTSGPALNILIKLMSIISLVLAPALRFRNGCA